MDAATERLRTEEAHMVRATYTRFRNGKWGVLVALSEVGKIGADGRVEVVRRDGGIRVETIYGPVANTATHRSFSITPGRGGGNDPDKDLK